jgi:hypothetical protein
VDKFLVKDYGPLKKYLWFPESERGKITDEFITESLSLLINLRQLDLTGCNQLTSACLKGHPQLEKLILDKTNLCPTDVRQADFPKLKEIVKNHNRFNLTLPCFIDFFRLDAMYEADEINCTSSTIRELLTEIVPSPNDHGINILKSLYFNKHKILSLTSEIIDVSRLVSDALIKIWKNLPPSDWNTPWSLGEKLLRDLIEIWEAERIRAEQEDPISKAFRDELSFKKNFWELDSVTGIGHETSYIITITESDLSRVYALLNALHGKTWGAFSGIIADIGSILISCSDQLFHKEISNTFIRGEDSDLVRIKMLQAIFVALSHNLNHSASLNIDYFLRLTDPNTVTKTIEVVKPSRLLKALDKKITKTLYPSKFFAQFTDHALACAFVMNVPNITLREYLLWHLLDSFREYHTINNYYSLPKIILGVVEEKDLPPKEFDSPLRKYLLQYKGVFAKNVSDKLKNAFWEALCEGHFDGHTQNALEGFNLFLNGLEKDSPYREKTLTAIEQLSKRLDKSRISQPV